MKMLGTFIYLTIRTALETFLDKSDSDSQRLLICVPKCFSSN
jgi:hypothetical protein